MRATCIMFLVFLALTQSASASIIQNSANNFTLTTSSNIQVKTFWDGINAYWYIMDPQGTILSYWTFPTVQSWKTTGGGSWQNENPVSVSSNLIGSTLWQNYTLDSGSRLYVKFNDMGSKIKMTWGINGSYNRNYQIDFKSNAVPSNKANLINLTKIFEFSDLVKYNWNDINGGYIVTSNVDANKNFNQYIEVGNAYNNLRWIDPTIEGGAIGYYNVTASGLNNGSWINLSAPVNATNITGTFTNFNPGFSESWADNTTKWDNDAVNTITDSVVSGWLRVIDATTSTYFKELSATGAQNRIKDSIFNASTQIGTGNYNISFNVRVNNPTALVVGEIGIGLMYANGTVETWAGLDDSSSGDTVIKNATLFPATQFLNRYSTVSNLQNVFYNINRTNGIVTVYANGVNISSGVSNGNIRYVGVVTSKYSVTYFNYAEIQNLTIGTGKTQYTFWMQEKTNTTTPTLNSSNGNTIIPFTNYVNPVQNFSFFNNISYNGMTVTLSVKYQGDTQSQNITASNGYYWQNTTYQPSEYATNITLTYPLNSATFTDSTYKGTLTATSNIQANLTSSDYNTTHVWGLFSAIAANYNATLNFSIPYNNAPTGSVNNQAFDFGSAMTVSCTPNDAESNTLNISMTVNGTLKQGSSCSFDFSGLGIGNYSSQVNITDLNGTIGTQPYPYLNMTFYVNVSADVTAPNAPTISNGTVGTTTIVLNSTNNTEINGWYLWEIAVNTTGVYSYLGNTTTNATTAPGLTPGQTYDFRLRVNDTSNNISPYSNVITIQTLTSDPTDALLLANDVLIINTLADIKAKQTEQDGTILLSGTYGLAGGILGAGVVIGFIRKRKQ